MMMEEYRRRLIRHTRQDIDCGYVTIDIDGLDFSGMLTIAEGSFSIDRISRIEVNGVEVEKAAGIPLTPGVYTVKVYYKNLYSCRDLLKNLRVVGDGVNRVVDVDVSHLDTSHSSSMANMIGGYVRDIAGLSSLDTGKVSDMSNMMFSLGMSPGVAIDLRGWDMSRVRTMRRMFQQEPIYSNQITIDVRGWNTSRVEDVSEMFFYTRMSSIDLSGWDMSNVKDMSGMFRYEPALTEVIMTGAVNPDADITDMFGNNNNEGTLYYNGVHDYSRIVDILPPTWRAVNISE